MLIPDASCIVYTPKVLADALVGAVSPKSARDDLQMARAMCWKGRSLQR